MDIRVGLTGPGVQYGVIVGKRRLQVFDSGRQNYRANCSHLNCMKY